MAGAVDLLRLERMDRVRELSCSEAPRAIGTCLGRAKQRRAVVELNLAVGIRRAHDRGGIVRVRLEICQLERFRRRGWRGQ